MSKIEHKKQGLGGRFQIVDLFQVAGRGPVVRGNILDGILKIGMVTQTTKNTAIKKPLTLAAVDYIDNISTHESWIGIMFQDSPSLAELQRALQADMILQFDWETAQ